MAGQLGLYFPNRVVYRIWAQHVDDEAPGLRTRLLAVEAPDGGCAVFFQLADQRTPLAADGHDVLLDAARRAQQAARRPSGQTARARP